MSSRGGTSVAQRNRSASVAARTTRPLTPKPPKPMTAAQRKTLATKTITVRLPVLCLPSLDARIGTSVGSP